jgi:hypothetical protein
MALSTAQALLAWAAAKLAVDFPPSFPDDATAKAHQISWRELIEQHPWVTEDVFRRSVTLIRMGHRGPFIPGPAVWLDYAQQAADELQREARAQHRRLPAPPPPTDDERRAEEDRAEAAKLKARLSLPERLRGKYTPKRGWR